MGLHLAMRRLQEGSVGVIDAKQHGMHYAAVAVYSLLEVDRIVIKGETGYCIFKHLPNALGRWCFLTLMILICVEVLLFPK